MREHVKFSSRKHQCAEIDVHLAVLRRRFLWNEIGANQLFQVQPKTAEPVLLLPLLLWVHIRAGKNPPFSKSQTRVLGYWVEKPILTWVFL
jgi:hypothetical protein